jgi:hypothetical protein
VAISKSPPAVVQVNANLLVVDAVKFEHAARIEAYGLRPDLYFDARTGLGAQNVAARQRLVEQGVLRIAGAGVL